MGCRSRICGIFHPPDSLHRFGDCDLSGLFDSSQDIISRILIEAGVRTRFPLNVATILGRLISSVITILGLFVAAVVVFPAFKPGDLVTGLGISSVAIGFAFKDILQNFFDGILILWRQPFILGDQIRSLNYEGTVEEINMRSTRITTYDGVRVILPNGDVYVNPIEVFIAYPHRPNQVLGGHWLPRFS